MRIEIVTFDGMDELDAVLPFEVLSNAAEERPEWDVALVGVRGGGEVVGSHGMRVTVEDGLGTPDALVVPGGGWVSRSPVGAWQQAQDGYLPQRLRELAAGCQWVASVCTGGMLLAAAGITNGRPATTHHGAHAELRESGAQLVADARVVDDGDLITCGGVTSGLDMALWLVERELGSEVAKTVSAEMEHERTGSLWRRPNG